MKNVICLLILALMLSCTAKKTATRSSSDTKLNQQNAITDVKTDQSKAAISSTAQLSDSTQKITKTTKYDTNKPILPETGKPPVSEETTTTETKISGKVVSTKTETANNTKSEVTDNTKIQSEAKAENKTVETPKKPAVAYWFYIIVIAAIAVGLFFGWPYIVKIKNFVFAILGIKKNSLT